jgi:hypothetical protein
VVGGDSIKASKGIIGRAKVGKIVAVERLGKPRMPERKG